MPIGPFERQILRLLAVQRSPESFVGGATVLHQADTSPRFSQDVDVFHDTAQSVAQCAAADLQTLHEAGYEAEMVVAFPTFHRATIRRGQHATKLEWVFDSAFRFFPVERDEELGWRLSFWDAATNKILALASRFEPRDLIDALFLHERHLSLGALVWAAAGKDAGLTPAFILDQIRRTTHYTQPDLDRLALAQPVTAADLHARRVAAVGQAEALVHRLPPAEIGCLYLDEAGVPHTPDPDAPAFSSWRRHYGCVGGAWPVVAG